VEGLKSMIVLEYLYLANNPFTEKNKSFRDVIVIRCPNLKELDGKEITKNEKLFVNSLYARKFGGNNLHTNKPNTSGKEKRLSSLNINRLNFYEIEEERKIQSNPNSNHNSNLNSNPKLKGKLYTNINRQNSLGRNFSRTYENKLK
jgi:hypothetical protein